MQDACSIAGGGGGSSGGGLFSVKTVEVVNGGGGGGGGGYEPKPGNGLDPSRAGAASIYGRWRPF